MIPLNLAWGCACIFGDAAPVCVIWGYPPCPAAITDTAGSFIDGGYSVKKFLDNKFFVIIVIVYLACIALAFSGSTLIDPRVLGVAIQFGGLIVAYMVYATYIKK